MDVCHHFILCFSEASENTKLAGRIYNLEKYFILLAQKLNKQETTNKELLAAISAQQQQRVQEKSALANAIGSLQGTVLQLSGKLNGEESKRKRKFLTSALNRLSNRLYHLGGKVNDDPVRGTSEIMTRETDSTSKLLGELLGKEASKALSLVGDDGAKAGPANSASSKPVVQQPAPQPQIGVTFPSTPTGQGPVGSASTSSVQPNAMLAAAKPPVSAGGYNVLPLVPAPTLPVQAEPASGPQVPLDPPSIGLSPKADPTAVSDELPVPGSVNPYEILTSSQIQPKTIFGSPGGTGMSSQGINPFEFLTTSQLPPIGLRVAKERVMKNSYLSKESKEMDGFGKQNKVERRGKQRFKQRSRGPQDTDSEGSGIKAVVSTGLNKVRKGSSNMKITNKVYKDPVYHDLVKALKMGSFSKVEGPAIPLKQQRIANQKMSHRPNVKVLNRQENDAQMKGVILQTDAKH